MSSTCLWGIFREREHSPGREADDTEILRLTAKHLEADGFQVRLKTPEEVSAAIDPRPDGVFLMCERTGILDLLTAWEAAGIPHVNRPGAVLDTYRERMIARFAVAGVPFVASRLVDTRAPVPASATPVWVKRADVHNTQTGDVILARARSEVADALATLADRGIERAVLQPHLDGDLIKFYEIAPAVRGEPEARHGVDSGDGWFRWFYHRDQRLAGHPVDAARLARLVRHAAAALGLEVYGGDTIATASGLVLLDLNAWPSFALYREEASAEIAAYLARRFAETRA